MRRCLYSSTASAICPLLKRFGEGFQLCTILNDARLLAMAAQAAVREAKGEAQAQASKTY